MDADTLGALGLVFVAFSNLVLWARFEVHLRSERKPKQQRSFYVAYHAAHERGYDTGAMDILTSEPVDCTGLNKWREVIAEKRGSDPENLIITFFAELDG